MIPFKEGDVMHNYLNLNVDKLLQELNTLPDLIVISDEEEEEEEEEVKYLGTRQSQPNLNLINTDELTRKIEIDCHPSKRRKFEQPTRVSKTEDLITLPQVTSLQDLFGTKKRKRTQAEEKPLKHEEGTKIEAYLHRPIKLTIPARNCSSLQQCPLSETIENATSVTNERDIQDKNLKERKKRDVSLVERFTEEEIKLHITSLDKGSREVCELKDKECHLCGEEDLMFPPPPLYCLLCNLRIKEDASYYIPEEEINDAQICNTCYNRSRSKFQLSGITISKPKMLKHNNTNNQINEEWVQCEACKKWQHQICGLYNKLKDDDKTAEYICPHCLLMEHNRRFDDNTDLGAKDLPETFLSEFIEKRLFKRLKEERVQTAKASDKSIDEVQEPKDLTLRVVYSADKTSLVNTQFADFFHQEQFPSEFPYRSKVILLFQKLEGVDVFIFGLFVQEFGSECDQPNQRTIYISYMDSVKYFRPQRATFAGEALRTFVFHEILIGYLDYCKIRGFARSYIWSCPPSKGEDYIMNSHPKTQQIPSVKKLRQWYLSMLDKALQRKIVTNVTNLYDRFFVTTEESRVAQLPYFEGSCWSDKAELLIQEIERLSETELQKKAKLVPTRKTKTMSYKTRGCIDVDEAKMILLTQKLEEMISKHKEDLLVVELNHSCTRCPKAISLELRWFCPKCKNLNLCQRCYDAEQKLPSEHKGKEKHWFSKVKENIQSTTEDDEYILKTDMFESRQEFLSFSRKNNYNFDTLRRAKHSSMMILHHLHTSKKLHCSEKSSKVTSIAKIPVAAGNSCDLPDMSLKGKKWYKTGKRSQRRRKLK